jgi:hypothetical protein
VAAQPGGGFHAGDIAADEGLDFRARLLNRIRGSQQQG